MDDEAEDSKGGFCVRSRVQVVAGRRQKHRSRRRPRTTIDRPGRWCGADSEIRPVKQTSFLPKRRWLLTLGAASGRPCLVPHCLPWMRA